MKLLEQEVTPADLARAIIAAHPGCALDFALQITRHVSRQLTFNAVNQFKAAAHIPRQSDADVVVATVCEFFGLSEEDLLGKRKFRRLSRPRHALWKLLRTELGWSLGGIAARFGTTATTVRAGCFAVNAESSEWDELRRRVAEALQPSRLEAAE